VGARFDLVTTLGATMSPHPRSVDGVGRRNGRRAAMRVLVLTLVWGTVLRNIGASVGAWAGGSLGATQTILIGVVIPAWLFVLFPSWLAFRIAAPRGFRRVALAACWMSPLVRLRDLPGIAAFLEVAADRPCPGWGQLSADAWTALAAALQADRRRSLAHANEIADALAHLPAGARFPWLARQHGVEALVVAAVIRRDWAAAARYGRVGHGRLVTLLTLLARATRGEPVSVTKLWLRWLLAPMRGTTLPLVRALARRSRIAPAGAAALVATSVHARHVGLLAAAARHEEIRTNDVLALAVAWQPALDDAARAALHARALELGVRDGAARAEALRTQVLDELALLLARAEGEVPTAPAQPIPEALARRTHEQQLARVKASLAALDADRVGPSLPPLAAWECWLALRAAWERAEQTAGRAALTTLWRTAMRDRLWSYCCALSHVHGPRAAWASYAMFDWLADRAEYVGDLVAVLANRENARLALAAAR
jgi:hypothetical protein